MDLLNRQIVIRNEEPRDYEAVERLTRGAFYNLYVPGCVEHFLVHIMRGHEDFVPELDLVLEKDGEIIGNIMYTKAKLISDDGNAREILTFGPVCVAPRFQRQGYGELMMERSFERAKELGFDVIIIFGSPSNYVSRGFKSCKKFNVCAEDGRFPAAMMVKELVPGALDGRHFTYSDSPVMNIDEAEAMRYDSGLPPMEKAFRPSQEEFFILSRAFLD